LIDKNLTKEEMRKTLKFSPSKIAKMGKGENVSMDVIERVCSHFQCSIEEVVQYIQEGEDEHDERGNLEANSI